MLYDTLLLAAILFAATLLFVLVFGPATHGYVRHGLQAFLWFVAGVYFTWSWLHGGQTLAMQTWRIKVTDRFGGPVRLRQALMRYFCATIFFGIGFAWAWFDREKLFLHDRLSGCRLVLTEKRQPIKANAARS